MASVEQWAEWRDKYLWDFHLTIDECAYKYAQNAVKDNGITLEPNKVYNLLSDAIERGYIDIEDDSFLFKTATFFILAGLNQRRLFPYQAKDALRDYQSLVKQHNDILCELKNFKGYSGCAIWFVNIPFLNALGFFVKNHPLLYKKYLLKAFEDINISYCSLTQSQLFEYLRSMSTFALYKLLVDVRLPRAEELFYAIQRNDIDEFNKITDRNNISFSEVADIAGYILNGQSIKVYYDSPEEIDAKNRTLLNMIGTKDAQWEDFLTLIYSHDFVSEVLPFTMTEEDTKYITKLAYQIAVFLPCLEMFDDDELVEVKRVLYNSYFTGYVKIAEYIHLRLTSNLPKGVKLLLSPEEMERFFPQIDVDNIYVPSSLQEKNGISESIQESSDRVVIDAKKSLQSFPESEDTIQGIKTLASRWMTEPYHRMSDDVLVEIISQKIWPKLINEVDNLLWTPARRERLTFQKTKNLLAACLLFHAMELSEIAKMPKQEKSAVGYAEYMSAEYRAQAGISATSKKNAGVFHTQKKYNDTLPVAYFETLKMFIPESDMPGRTSSRTYLKLLNTWVWKSFEKIYDNIESETSGKLFIAEYSQDLRAQAYLYKDNRTQLKSLLNKWRNDLPELFNFPI